MLPLFYESGAFCNRIVIFQALTRDKNALSRLSRPFGLRKNQMRYRSHPMAEAPSTAAELPSNPLIRNLALPLNTFRMFAL